LENQRAKPIKQAQSSFREPSSKGIYVGRTAARRESRDRRKKTDEDE